MLPSTFAILTAFLPFLSLTVNAAHNAPPHLRHRRLATALHHTLDETNQGAVLPRHDTPHAKAKRAITGAVQKRGPKQQCRVRNAASSAQSSQTTLSSASSNEIPEPSATSTSATVPNQEAWAKHVSSGRSRQTDLSPPPQLQPLLPLQLRAHRPPPPAPIPRLPHRRRHLRRLAVPRVCWT